MLSDKYRAQSIDGATSILQQHGFVIFASGMNPGDLQQMSWALSHNGVRKPRGHVQNMATYTNADCMACFTTAPNVAKDHGLTSHHGLASHHGPIHPYVASGELVKGG